MIPGGPRRARIPFAAQAVHLGLNDRKPPSICPKTVEPPTGPTIGFVGMCWRPSSDGSRRSSSDSPAEGVEPSTPGRPHWPAPKGTARAVPVGTDGEGSRVDPRDVVGLPPSGGEPLGRLEPPPSDGPEGSPYAHDLRARAAADLGREAQRPQRECVRCVQKQTPLDSWRSSNCRGGLPFLQGELIVGLQTQLCRSKS